MLDEVLDLHQQRRSWQDIWAHDETIGWIYQYFTPKELRDQARKESAGAAQQLRAGLPQPVLHAALRGRVPDRQHPGAHLVRDAEGRHGAARAVPLPRAPPERNLPGASGESRRRRPPAATRAEDAGAGGPHPLPGAAKTRADPRARPGLRQRPLPALRLRPAGNDLRRGLRRPPIWPGRLQRDYPTLEPTADIPRLILADNLHGIDIDLRATQIAAFALWLRAQRSYQASG